MTVRGPIVANEKFKSYTIDAIAKMPATWMSIQAISTARQEKELRQQRTSLRRVRVCSR